MSLFESAKLCVTANSKNSQIEPLGPICTIQNPAISPKVVAAKSRTKVMDHQRLKILLTLSLLVNFAAIMGILPPLLGKTPIAQAVPVSSRVPSSVQSDEHPIASINMEKILLSKDSGIDQNGDFTRREILETDFKYPHILLDENWHVDQQGKKTLKSRNAFVADHLLVTLQPDADISRFSKFVTKNNWSILKMMPLSKMIVVKIDAAEDLFALDSARALLKSQTDLVHVVEPDGLAFN